MRRTITNIVTRRAARRKVKQRSNPQPAPNADHEEVVAKANALVAIHEGLDDLLVAATMAKISYLDFMEEVERWHKGSIRPRRVTP